MTPVIPHLFNKLNTGAGVISPAPDPCDLPIGPTSLATDCHTAAGLLFWYKADVGVIPGGEGVKITQWNDQSGNGRNATQGNAADQDVFRTHKHSVPTVYGQPYNTLTNPKPAGFYNIPGFFLARGSLTVYAAFRQYVFNADTTPFTNTGNVLLAAASLHGGISFFGRANQTGLPTDSKIRMQASKGALQIPYAAEGPALCNWQVATGVLDAGNSLISVYLNGLLLDSQPYAPEAATFDTAWTVLGIQSFDFNNVEGNVLEIQVYSTAHTAAQIAAKALCLATEWGI